MQFASGDAWITLTGRQGGTAVGQVRRARFVVAVVLAASEDARVTNRQLVVFYSTLEDFALSLFPDDDDVF